VIPTITTAAPVVFAGTRFNSPQTIPTNYYRQRTSTLVVKESPPTTPPEGTRVESIVGRCRPRTARDRRVAEGRPDPGQRLADLPDRLGAGGPVGPSSLSNAGQNSTRVRP
jgi:hypothetical protein